MASQPPQVTQADIDAYIANYQAQQANINALNQAALAAAQGTGASNIDYYVNPIGAGEIIPGLNAGILSNLGMYNPEYQAVMRTYGSQTDKANENDVTERSTFAVDPNADYRLVDASGKVIGTASNALEVRNLVDTANALSEEEGKKAEWKLQQTGATGGWNTVAQDDPNTIPTSIKLIGAAMAAATAAGALQPGGFMGAGTTGAGTTAGATGAGLAEGASLASQGLASLPANLAAIQSGANAALAGAGLGAGAAGAAGTGLLSAAAPGAFEAAPIVVTAGGSNFVLPSVAALTAGATTAGLAGGAATPPATTSATQPADSVGPDLTLTAKTPTNILPEVLATGAAATAAAAANATGATSTQADRITPTAKETAALNAGAGAGGVLGTGLSLTELATLGSLGASAVGSLFGGSGGTTGAGTPYVSPFGTGGTMAGGQDFRASPAIADYERYGFGPEASFFRPEYYGLVSGGASKGYTAGGATTPTYTPLISGKAGNEIVASNPAFSDGTMVDPNAGGQPPVQQVRPEGFTGVVSGQKVGDTQVVDGNTWVWGGDNVGWQQKFTNGLLSTGNGATNVSSFANNPTVEVNQPYFAQNTANIPGWATTYQGFQQGLMGAGITGDAKAAAERELFSAIETQPFANATALVDYAKNIYNKYTSAAPSPTMATTTTGGTGGLLGVLNSPSASSSTFTPNTKALMSALAPNYDPNKPLVWNGPYVPSNEPMPVGNIPEGAEDIYRGLLG